MKKKASKELADFLRFCQVERRLAPRPARRTSATCRPVWVTCKRRDGARRCEVTTCGASSPSEQSAGRPPSSQARTTAALKLLPLLVEEEWLARDPALPLRTPKKREALPDVLTMCELGGCSRQRAGTTSGSGTSTASLSATGYCWR